MTYDIIYADPPYRFKNYSDDWHRDNPDGSRWVGQQYPISSVDDIAAMPIRDLASKDSCLFLWVTMPHLQNGLAIMNEWGFTYKTTAFTWIKTNKNAGTPFVGMGFWTRSNAELCLLGTRGHPVRVNKAVRQVVMAPRGRHSAKPPEVRDRIVALLGDLPRIELFARERTPGWAAFGDEVESDVALELAGGIAP